MNHLPQTIYPSSPQPRTTNPLIYSPNKHIWKTWQKKDIHYNPILHGGTHCARDRFFWLLLEHQGSWEIEIFRGGLKFIQVFELQKVVSKTLCLVSSGPFVCNLSEIWKRFLPNQCPNSHNKSWIYWLFTVFCFNYINNWLRIYKLYLCKQFQIIFGKTGAIICLFYIICR